MKTFYISIAVPSPDHELLEAVKLDFAEFFPADVYDDPKDAPAASRVVKFTIEEVTE